MTAIDQLIEANQTAAELRRLYYGLAIKEGIKTKVKNEIEKFSGELNEYQSGYKQALVDIENLIN
jgi:hypothetical protein